MSRPVQLALCVAIIFALLAVTQCHSPDASKQAQQSSAAADALGNAAQATVERIGARVATEQEVDRATALTLEEIGNAQDPAAIRAAVLDRLCAKASHRTDPACTMR